MQDRPPRRFGCMTWCYLGLGGVVITVLIFAVWLRSTSDLDAQMRRARDLGLSTDWPTLCPAGPIHADIAAVRRFSKIADRATTFVDPSDGKWTFHPFLTPPVGLATWSDAVETDLDPLLDGLSGQMVWTVDPTAIREALIRGDAQWVALRLTAGWNRSEVRSVLDWRSGRGGTDVQIQADRLAKLATTVTSPALTEHMASLYLANSWQTHVLRHHAALDPVHTAATARALANRLDMELSSLIAAWPLVLDQEMRLPPEALFRALNIRLPAVMTFQAGMHFFHRAGRATIVARAIDVACWVAKHGLPVTSAQVHAASPPGERLTLMNAPQEFLSSMLDQGGCQHCSGQSTTMAHSILMWHLRRITGLRAMAADMDGGPWPTDPGDPRGSLLRPIIRDGVVIGVYGCGANEIDDGGDIRLDCCWPLRAELGSPKASDPSKTP